MARDLARGAQMRAVWQSFAWDEIQNRYRRSKIGLTWIALSFFIFVFAIGLFFNGFASRSATDFLYYVAVGFACFSFLVGNFVDGAAVFKTSANWIKSSTLPYSIYIFKSIARAIFPFFIQLACALTIMILTGWRPSLSLLWCLPALLAYVGNAIWVQIFMGLLAARWQDVSHLVSAITRLLFFTTPIVWVFEERSGLVLLVANLNPLTHFLEILRSPMLGVNPSLTSWLVVGGFTFIGWAITFFAAGRMMRRLPFWV